MTTTNGARPGPGTDASDATFSIDPNGHASVAEVKDVLKDGTRLPENVVVDRYNDVPALLARLAEVEAERDAANDLLEVTSGKRDVAFDNLAAENARLRPVVEAAEALAAAAEQSTAPRTPLFAAFLAAVDSYRVGRDARGD